MYTYGTEITVLYMEVSPTRGVRALHETGRTHKNHVRYYVDRSIVRLGI